MAAAKLGGAFVRIAAWTFMRSRAELAREPRGEPGASRPANVPTRESLGARCRILRSLDGVLLDDSAEMRFIAPRVRRVAAGAGAGGRGDASRPGRRLLL